MKKATGFSLAEALITLLIVCIIAIATVPMITKKKKSPRSAAEILWNVDSELPTITPAASRDIKLGKTSLKKTQGIIVVERLEFKDRQGKVIGWVDEDGSSSFANTDVIMSRQEDIIKMLNSITMGLSQSMAFSSSNGTPTDRLTGRERLERAAGKANGGQTGRERLTRGKNKGNTSNEDSSSVSPEQMEQIRTLQKQLEIMLQNRQQ